jgi:hypothetical protein
MWWCGAVAVVCVLFVQVVGCAIGSIGYVVFVLSFLLRGAWQIYVDSLSDFHVHRVTLHPLNRFTPPPPSKVRQLNTHAPF